MAFSRAHLVVILIAVAAQVDVILTRELDIAFRERKSAVFA